MENRDISTGFRKLSILSKFFIAQYIKKQKQPDNDIGYSRKYDMRSIFLGKLCTNYGGKGIGRPFLKNQN